jgi:hypothetical protein
MDTNEKVGPQTLERVMHFATPEASRKLAGGGAKRNHRKSVSSKGLRPGRGEEVELNGSRAPLRGAFALHIFPVVALAALCSTTG